ncbi:MAG: AI-2E family transporter [Chloroflexota bacterium]
MKPRRQGQLFFYGLLLFTLFVSYQLLQPYLGVIVFAVVFVTIFYPLYTACLNRFKHHNIALAVTLVVIVFLVVVPLYFLMQIMVSEGAELVNDVNGIAQTITGTNPSLTKAITQINDLLSQIPLESPPRIEEADIISRAQNLITPVSSFLADRALAIGSTSAELLTKLIIFLSILGALFPNYEKLTQLVKDLSPLDDNLDQVYINRLVAMTKAMVRGVFVIALVQAVTMGFFYWIVGTKYTFFLTVLSVFAAILPLGVNILAVPVGITHIVLGNTVAGIVVMAGALFVVSQMDNVLRPKLVSDEAYLNPALVVLSAFGGLSLFGFLGVVYGPILMIFIVTTVEIYLDHFQAIPANEATITPPKAIEMTSEQTTDTKLLTDNAKLEAASVAQIQSASSASKTPTTKKEAKSRVKPSAKKTPSKKTAKPDSKKSGGKGNQS